MKQTGPDLLPVPVELAARKIRVIRGQRVMLDTDLAEIYQVETRALNQAVKRNSGRFPADFMFRLAPEEIETVNRSQIVTGSQKHRDPRSLPYAFTELGVAMLSSVLRSERAVQMNIVIMRAFVRLRELLATNRALAQRIEQLTATVKDHGALFDIVINDIQNLDTKVTRQIRRLKAPRRSKSRIGFYHGDKS
jgi:hypothetical protein